MARKVLIGATNFSRDCGQAKAILLKNGFVTIENPYQRTYTSDELRAIAVDVDAVIAGTELWDATIISLAKNLKIISRFGVGMDNIDREAAEKHGITVCNAKGQNACSVANMTVALMLGAIRKIVLFDKTTRQGGWKREIAQDLDEKVVGFLGFGDIAQKTAKRISGFEPHMIAWDKYPDEASATALNVSFVGFEDLLRKSDIVSVHLPYLAETYHILGMAQFEMMKPSAILVNTARGPLINEADLYKALKMGIFSGAALDVYEIEPVKSDNPLFTLDNVICTPHTAAETLESCYRVSVCAAQSVVDYFKGINSLYTVTSKPF